MSINEWLLWAQDTWNAWMPLKVRLIEPLPLIVPAPEPKSTNLSRTVITQMIRSQHTDDRGFALGGEILAWIDIVAGVTAKRHAGNAAVTASMDAVTFFAPVKTGDMCILHAVVNRTWKTSMEIGVLVEGENMLDGTRRFCCYALLTFVAVKDGKPVPVAPVIPQVCVLWTFSCRQTLEEEQSFEQAEHRRQARFARKKVSRDPMPIESQIIPRHSAPSPGVKSARPTQRDRASFSSHDGDDHEKEMRIHRPLSKFASDSYTEIVEIVFPEHANSLGITFGGQIMKWMEYTAVMAAAKHCRSHLLTASMDSVTFLRPTRVGDVILIKGIVSQAFSHSVEVYVTVETESLCASTRQITNDGWLTLVSVDKDGELVQVPSLNASSLDQEERKKGGRDRRQKRLMERDQLAKLVY